MEIQIKKKNRHEDFKLLIGLSDYKGEDFILTFCSGKYGRRYECRKDGDELTNCVMVDSTHVLCLLNDHGLELGTVWLEIRLKKPDPQMPDGDFRLASFDVLRFEYQGELCELRMTDGVSDIFETVAATFEMLGPVLRGEQGPQGPQGEPGVDGVNFNGAVGFSIDDDGNLIATMSDSNELDFEIQGEALILTIPE